MDRTDMAEIWFYEKPGCINNTKQKALLRQSGHQVIACNLLEEPWQEEVLRRFFADLPVSEWFNRTAPAVKSGKVDPDVLNEARALELMIEDPILIRRPLMRVGEEYRTGFDSDSVREWIGLSATDGQDLESCPQQGE
jgi:nitrogenase-associated protein